MKNTLFTMALILCFNVYADDFKAHFINVGQADATLLEFSKGVVMIDVGAEGKGKFAKESADSLDNYLNKFYLRRADLNKTIDLLVLTHNHSDHYFLIKYLSEKYTIKRIITTKHNLKKQALMIQEAATAEGIQLEYIDYALVESLMPNGKQITLEKLVKQGETIPEITLYSGEVNLKDLTVNGIKFSKTEMKKPNNNSIVTKVTFNTATLLFTGDLQIDGINYLFEKYKGNLNVFDVNFYHVGHHGAFNGTDEKLLSVLTPEVAVISAGDSSHNVKGGTAYDYGHPNKTAIETLNKQSSIKPLSTGKNVYCYNGEETKPIPIEVKRDIYCTCWTDSILITFNSNGTYFVIE